MAFNKTFKGTAEIYKSNCRLLHSQDQLITKNVFTCAQRAKILMFSSHNNTDENGVIWQNTSCELGDASYKLQVGRLKA